MEEEVSAPFPWSRWAEDLHPIIPAFRFTERYAVIIRSPRFLYWPVAVDDRPWPHELKRAAKERRRARKTARRAQIKADNARRKHRR